MLMFKKEFFPAIVSGGKTTTLRMWRYARVKPGSLHNVRGLGRLVVDSIETIEPSDLTDAHALADGFASVDELRGVLAAIYSRPNDTDGKRLYLVRFRYLG